ncbi:hypothetical protein GGI07_005793 [Coemansia sp. Benny D115]|nr:hypothetical protein GGI07_005793 [Coemansia sp. Benny D115]
MIPEALQVHRAAQTRGANPVDDSTTGSIMREQPEKMHQGPNERTVDDSMTDSGSTMAAIVSHALRLWNAKDSASDFISWMQVQSLLVIERCLPGQLATSLFGQVSGTVSAARAGAIELEEAEGHRNMLAKTEGPISCIAWHPHRSLVAISHRATDTVFLYDMSSGSWCPNVLQNAYMRGITAMTWQPNGGYTLAVGCVTGVCLWNIIPAGTTRQQPVDASAPSLGFTQFSSWMTLMSFPPLKKQYQYPAQLPQKSPTTFRRSNSSVSALGFSPDGQWLITGHQSHGHLTVWDVALGTATPLKRSGSTGRSATLQLSISPNGRYLVSSHANGQLRLWETEGWTSRVWSDFKANISQFTWSPDSRSLFFAVLGCSDIYTLALYKPSPSLDAEIALVSSFEVHSTAASDANQDSEPIRVGGAIKSLCIDPKGQRLVVGFDDDSTSSDISLLAVYLVNTDALFRVGGDTNALMPLGYIRGPNWGRQAFSEDECTANAFAASASAPAAASVSSSSSDRVSRKKRVRLGLPTPSWFGFAPNFEPGALLTVAWANGKVTFIPMLFRDTKNASD